MTARTIGDVTSNLPSDAATLAASARSCPLFRDAVEFAADGVPSMGRPWAFAAGAGLMGSARDALGDGEVLERWLAGVSAVLAGETADDEDDGALLLVLSVLGAVKARETGRLRGAFWEVVRVRLQDLCDHAGSRFPFRTRRQYTEQQWGNELPGVVRLLTECGMAAPGPGAADEGPAWTDLGRWAYTALPGAIPWPASPALSPAELVGYVMGFSEDRIREHVVSGWFDGRDPVPAARELLTAAGTMTAPRRMFAMWIAHGIGEDALSAWRSAAGDPDAGPYARMVLRQAGELASPADADLGWLAVEKAAVMLEQDNPDEALTVLWEAALPADSLAAMLEAVPATGHPDADTVAKQVTGYMESGAPRSVEHALELRVALGDGGTWLSVQVPAIFTLADLHDVIQELFGWDGSQPHVFRVGKNSYSGGPRHAEGTGYDDEVRLRGALGRAKRITYTYGAPPELEITQVRKLPQDPLRSYPRCTGGSGGCDIAEVNRRL